jgi:septum formation protein
MLGVKNLKIIPADVDESQDPALGAAETVGKLSRDKARAVRNILAAGGVNIDIDEDAVIIAADTVVSADGEILGKPADEREAAQMLRKLSGRWHEVYTSVTVMAGEREITEFQKTLVRFRELTAGEIEAYIKTGEPMDKAGAYGAQGIGALFITGIEGDFFTVMGLPLCRLGAMLREMGVSLI